MTGRLVQIGFRCDVELTVYGIVSGRSLRARTRPDWCEFSACTSGRFLRLQARAEAAEASAFE